MWYLLCIALGIIVGMIIEDVTNSELKYEGKIKVKGKNNTIQIKKSIEERITKRKERKEKRKGLFKRKSTNK